MTGRNITLGKYALDLRRASSLWSLHAAACSAARRSILSLLFGLFVGIGGPHFVIGQMIKRRIAKFNSNFPDAIDLMVRGLRSGLPITETLGIVSGEIPGPVGIEFRTVADKMKIGRTMEAALQETADRLGHARIPVLRHHAGDPARDRRQPRRDAVEPVGRAAQARADEAQDPRDELGIEGLGLYRRLAAVHRLHARVHDQPRLHGRLLHRSAADRRRASAASSG